MLGMGQVGVSAGAVRGAFRSLMTNCHPDKIKRRIAQLLQQQEAAVQAGLMVEVEEEAVLRARLEQEALQVSALVTAAHEALTNPVQRMAVEQQHWDMCLDVVAKERLHRLSLQHYQAQLAAFLLV